MKSMHYLFIAGLLCVHTAAMAQDKGPVLSFGLIGAQGDSNDLTNKPWGGTTFELGWAFAPSKEAGYGITPYVGWGRMPGEKNLPNRNIKSVWGPNSYDLTHWRAGFDINIQPFGKLPLTVVFGPSIHSWQVERIGALADTQFTDNGLKMGWRVGLTYPLSSQWALGFRFTQTEWRAKRDVSGWPGYISDTQKTPSEIKGLNPSRPAYMTLMATYSF